MAPLRTALAFMDGGRVADEFEPALRKQVRSTVVVLSLLGIALVTAAVISYALWVIMVALALFVAGASLTGAAVLLWVKSR